MSSMKSYWLAAICLLAGLCITAPATAQTGACCRPDATCVVATQADCETTQGGCYLGNNTTCTFVECQAQPYDILLDQGAQELTFNKFNTMGGTRVLLAVKVCMRGTSLHEIGQTLLAQRQTCVFESETEADMRITLDGLFKDVAGVPALQPISVSTPLFGGADATRFCGNPLPIDDIVLCPTANPTCNGAVPGGCPLSCNYNGQFGFSGMSSFFANAGAPLVQFTAGPGNLTFRVNVSGDSIFVAPVTFASFSNPVNEAQGPVIVIYLFAPTGACCLPNNTCVVTTSDDCTAQGGMYAGDNTVCGGTGACCLPNGTCVVAAEICCTQFLNGTYQGNGTTCGASGACCLPNGNCISVPQICCDDQGGTFIGGACSGNTGACCLPNNTCIVTNQTCCTAQGGVFQGNGTTCGPTGACCLANGTCISVPQICCDDAGGTFIGGACSGNSGACCLPNGTCFVANQTCCTAQGGVFQGNGTTCGPTGACCLANGTCVSVAQVCCDDQGGTFIGGACSGNTGACCLPNNTCFVANQTCCTAQGGTFQGNGTVCGPTGACCLANGTCISVPQVCCDDAGGTFIGGACSNNTGACCLPNNTCFVANQTCCTAQGGTFQGNGTVCGPNGACCLANGTCISVPQICCDDAGGSFIGGACSGNSGACCLPNGTCISANQTCCTAQGGTFQGNGTVCGASGACCLPNGTCVTTPMACCALQGGTFVGGPCGGVGACCLPNGSCVQTDSACCTLQGGTFIGVGVACGGTGACCLPNGTCVVMSDACCVLAGGTYVGNGTSCGGSGACCLPDGTCSVQIQACCAISGGAYAGDGTVCGPLGRCCLTDGSCQDNAFQTCCELGGGVHTPGLTCADQPPCVPQKGGCYDKGSLLFFSKIEIRWTDAGTLIQDTFLQLTNDYPVNVTVQAYFINGDPPLAANGAERAHPGWNWVDNKFNLTADQPIYWSALTGLGASGIFDPTMSPFTVLDPGFPPGRPDPFVPGERMLRGFIVLWAVHPTTHVEIRWNHLAGNGTLINYRDAWAWEYKTCAFPVVAPVAHGAPTGLHPGELHLDGFEYRSAAAQLLMNFQASGGTAFSGPRLVSSQTDVTLHLVDADLRQETEGPVTTKAHYLVWNQNEAKRSGAYRCITCWDQTLLANYGLPNHFGLLALGTNFGKARIDGLASALCDRDLYGAGGPGTPPDGVLDVISRMAALTGLTARLLTIDTNFFAHDGTNLFDLGAEDAVIKYDLQQGPPEVDFSPDSPEDLQHLLDQLTGKSAGIYPSR